MSEEAKVEAADAETDPEAFFKEAAEKERQAAQGQVDDAGLSGQPAADTPGEDADKTPPASEEPAKPDWDNAPAPLREAYAASEKARRDAETLVGSHGARLTQAYQERDALNVKLAEAAKVEGPKAEQEGDETSEEYRTRMKEEYPEFAPLFDRLDAAEAKVGQMEGSLESVKATAAATQTEEALQQQGKVFEQAHPDWEKEKNDPAVQASLIEWAQKQPRYVQDELQRNALSITDGSSAADLISRFKRETADGAKAELKERRAGQMDASRDARVNTPGATNTGAADNDVEGLWKEFAAADARKAAGDRHGRR